MRVAHCRLENNKKEKVISECENTCVNKSISKCWSMFFFQVYKRVLVRGTEYSSIINFYNSVFVDSLKDYVVQFADGRHVSLQDKM